MRLLDCGHAVGAVAGRRPRGAIILVVLVALIVASAVLVSVARLALTDRTAWRMESWEVQAAWLAESGLDRAAARIKNDPAYQGETWTLPAELFDGRHGGKVVIDVQAVGREPSQRRIRIQADYPDDPQDRARRMRETVFSIEQGES